MPAGTGSKPPIKSARTLFSIVEALQELDGATLTELASHLDMATSTIHNHLSTLENLEYVINQDGEYQIGLRFFEHGVWAKRNYGVADVAQNSLEHLAEQVGEMVWLLVEEHGRAVCVEKAAGEHAVQTYAQLGKRIHIHAAAGGKALLAFLPQERIDEIIEQNGLPAQTGATITDPDDLKQELERIRQRGYAINDGETIDGIRAIAAPVRPNGELVASISVAGPRFRMTGEYFSEELPELVLGVANEVELKLVHN